ncbi:MAG TPA: hypothetical protein PKE21_13170 [Flavobacteriales bacterium]|nr:hypothetical protein [Flavobacteriales bacterium]HMR28426.1 hypothetical protein [Flavobacteriales bacterium]
MRPLPFLLLMLLLCGWHLDRGPNDNTMSRAAMVAALVEHGSLCIDPYHMHTQDKSLIDGHHYSDKAPLPALLVAPVYAALVAAGAVAPGPDGLLTPQLLMLGGLLCGSVPLALIITLCWMRLRRQATALSPVLLAALPFLGSFLFVYSGSFNAHLLGALFALLALIAVEDDRPFVAGLWCGCAVLCEYPLAVLAGWWALRPLWGEGAWHHRMRSSLRFIAGGLPAAVLLLVYNTLLTGSPFSIGYEHEAHYTFMHDSYGLALPSLSALWGLTFSGYRGLFVHMPVLLAGLLAWGLSTRRTASFRYDPVLPATLLLLLVIASYRMWWGGWALGPRHLSAAAVLLAWRWLPLVSEHRWLRPPVGVLGAFGLFVAVAAKCTVWYSFPTEVRHPLRDRLWPALRDGGWTDMQVPVAFGLSPAASSAAFVVLLITVMAVLWWHERTRGSLP